MEKIILSTNVEIEMREPKVRDMRIVSDITDEVEKEIKLLGNLTGLTSDELDDLSLKDYGLLQKGLQTFL
jgi:hypothetical protein